MQRSTILLMYASVFLFSCNRRNLPTTETADIESMNAVRNYAYADSSGRHLLLNNSLPKSRINYTAPDGTNYVYAVFWTQLKNETTHAVDLNIEFPSAAFEFPRSSGNFMLLRIPSDTVAFEKLTMPEYGLDVKTFLDTGIHKSYAFNRTVGSKDSTGFYVVALSKNGAGGALRTALSIHGQNLLYKLSVFNNRTPELALIDTIQIHCGSINLPNLLLQN